MVWLWGLYLVQLWLTFFVWSFENRQLEDCRHGLKPVFYTRYVDDMFVRFSSLDHAEMFKEYLSSKHHKINFSLE